MSDEGGVTALKVGLVAVPPPPFSPAPFFPSPFLFLLPAPDNLLVQPEPGLALGTVWGAVGKTIKPWPAG